MKKDKNETWDEDYDQVEPKKKEKRMSGAWIWLILFFLVLDAAAFVFVLGEHHFSRVFLEGTTVNGQDVSGMTAEEVKQRITQETSDYTLVIRERTASGDFVTEAIGAREIGLETLFDTSLERALHEQTGGNWLKRRGGQTAVSMDTLLQYDETAFGRRLDGLQCFSDAFIKAPVDASISDYQSGVGYQVIPEEPGNQPNADRIREAISQAVLKLSPDVDLDQVPGAYAAPAVTVSDAGLQGIVDKMNFYAGVRITYTFDDQVEVLDGDTIHKWISVKGDGTVTLNTSGADDFVVYLRKKYATIGRPRTFMTSYGVEVSFTGEQGDYGWWMNWTKEQEELREMILAGISGERTPVWFQRANSFGEHDYGDTYVEVNVTGQHVFFYKDGVLQMDTDCVTGNASRGNDTPDGVYVIKYKERNATLEGENYSSPVSYWMPFNGNIGLHDATWRWEFGSSLYLSSGSHGCVNLPYTFAKALYSMVQGKDEDKGLVAGTPVIVYHLPNTESSSITTQNEQDLAQAVVDAIDYIGEVKKTKECEKRITRARDLYNDLSRSGRDYVTNYDDLKRAEQEYDNL